MPKIQGKIKSGLYIRMIIIATGIGCETLHAGIVPVILPYFAEEVWNIEVNSEEYDSLSGLLTTLYVFFHVLGMIAGGIIFYEFKRKPIYIINEIFFLIFTCLMQITTQNYFIAFRVISGYFGGSLQMMCILDLAELYTRDNAAKILSSIPIGLCIGKILADSTGLLVLLVESGWRYALFFPVPFILVRLLFYTFNFKHENPRFLLLVRFYPEQCKSSLHELYDYLTAKEVFQLLITELDIYGREKTLIELIKSTKSYYRMFLGISLSISKQILGGGLILLQITEFFIISYSNYYTRDYDEVLIAGLVLISGFVSLAGSIVGSFLFNNFKNKPLIVGGVFLLWGLIIFLAVSFNYNDAKYTLGPLFATFFVYTIVAATGFHIVESEILPKKAFILMAIANRIGLLILSAIETAYGLNIALLVISFLGIFVVLLVIFGYKEIKGKDQIEILKIYKDIQNISIVHCIFQLKLPFNDQSNFKF